MLTRASRAMVFTVCTPRGGKGYGSGIRVARLVLAEPFTIGLDILALLVGFAKGRFVFAKTVWRVVSRIQALSLPIRFSQVYTKSYWILIGAMMMLGLTFRFLPIPLDARGFVDVAIGSALINGAMLYFRASRSFAKI